MARSDTVVAVVGPTATGKSDVAVQIALRHDGEIVGADSRHIYRGMDIGTAKPPREHLAAVRHHMVDIVEPDEPYSIALYLRQARLAVADILERGKLPIVAGGSGQYVWGLLEGWQIPDAPPSPALRAELEARAASEGGEALYRELAGADPEAAERIHPRNVRRVIRALELRQTSQGAVSPLRKTAPPFNPVIVGLMLARADLYRRIDARVDAMMDAGWLDEVRALMDSGCSLDLPSMSSLGYSEIGRSLNDEVDLAEAVQAIKTRTHRFARQQHAWFRTDDERIAWFDASTPGEAILDHVAQRLSP